MKIVTALAKRLAKMLCYGRYKWSPCHDQLGQTRHAHQTSKNKVDTILFNAYDDAEYALNVIKSLYDNYGRVTIADYYWVCKKPSEYTDTKYGWTCIDGRFVVCEDLLYHIACDDPRDHIYYIDLPEPETLD